MLTAVTAAAVEVASSRRGRLLTVHAEVEADVTAVIAALRASGDGFDVHLAGFSVPGHEGELTEIDGELGLRRRRPGSVDPRTDDVEVLMGRLRSRISPGRTVVLLLADLDRAAVPFVWSEYFLERQLPKLLATRALLVVAVATPAAAAGRRAEAPTAVADHLRVLQAEPPVTRSRLEGDEPAVLLAQATRMLDRLDAVDGVQPDDEHLRDARRAHRLVSAVLARAPDLVGSAERTRVIGRLGVSAERVGWLGDALRCAALIEEDETVVRCLRSLLRAERDALATQFGLEVPWVEAILLPFDEAAVLAALEPRIDGLPEPARLIERAHLDAFQQRHDAAVEHATHALELVPDDPELQRLRARSLVALGDLEAGISAYWSAVGAGDDAASDLATIARLRVEQGRTAEALSPAAYAIVLKGDAWLSLGAALIARGDRVAGARLAAAGTKLDAAALAEALALAPEDAGAACAWATQQPGDLREFVTAATGIDQAATAAFLETVQRTS